jgi:TP901 family phage tail tape measure protein
MANNSKNGNNNLSKDIQKAEKEIARIKQDYIDSLRKKNRAEVGKFKNLDPNDTDMKNVLINSNKTTVNTFVNKIKGLQESLKEIQDRSVAEKNNYYDSFVKELEETDIRLETAFDSKRQIYHLNLVDGNGHSLYKTEINVSGDAYGYRNGMPGVNTPFFHLGKDGVYVAGKENTVFRELRAQLHKIKTEPEKYNSYRERKNLFKKATDYIDGIVAVSGNASINRDTRNSWRHGQSSQTRAETMKTKASLVPLMRETIDDVVNEVRADVKKNGANSQYNKSIFAKEGLDREKFASALFKYVSARMMNDGAITKAHTEIFTKNTGITDAEIKKLIDSRLKKLYDIRPQFAYGSETQMQDMELVFGGGQQYLGQTSIGSASDTRARQQNENVKRRLRENVTGYKRGTGAAFRQRGDRHIGKINDSPEQLTYNIAMVRRDAFFNAWRYAREKAEASIRNNVEKNFKNNSKNAKYLDPNGELTADGKNLINQKVQGIMRAQGWHDMAPELREDMSYGAASAMKELVSKNIKTTRIDEEEFQYLLGKSGEKWNELLEKNKGKKEFRFGNKTYKADDSKTFINDFIASKAIDHLKFEDIAGNANVSYTNDENGKAVYDIQADQIVNKEFLKGKWGGQTKVTDSTGGRSYRERMADPVFQQTMQYLFYQEELAKFYLKKTGDTSNKSIAEMEQALTGEEKKIEKILNEAKVKSKAIDAVEENNIQKLQNTWGNITGILEHKFKELGSYKNKEKFLNKLRKNKFFESALDIKVKGKGKNAYISFKNTKESDKIFEEFGLTNEKGTGVLDFLISEGFLTKQDFEGNHSLIASKTQGVGDVYQWSNEAAISYKERAGIERSLTASGSGESASKAIMARFGNYTDEAKKAQDAIADIDEIINKNGLNESSRNWSDTDLAEKVAEAKTGDIFTVGYGTEYDLNLENFTPDKMDRKRGAIIGTKENLQKSIIGQFINSGKSRMMFAGKMGYGPITDDYNNEILSGGRVLYLDKSAIEEKQDAITKETVYNMPSFMDDFNEAMFLGGTNDKDKYTKATAKALNSMFLSAHHTKGDLFTKANKVRISGSGFGKTSAVSVQDILNKEERLKSIANTNSQEYKDLNEEIIRLKTGAFVSRGGMMSTIKGAGKGLSKKEYMNNLFVELKKEDPIAYTTLDDLLKTYTGKKGGEKAWLQNKVLESATKHGLSAGFMRYPSIGMEPVGFTRMYVDEGLGNADDTIKLGAALAGAFKADYDGDMVAVLPKMLGSLEAYEQDKTEDYHRKLLTAYFDKAFKNGDYEYNKGEWKLKNDKKSFKEWTEEIGSPESRAFKTKLSSLQSKINKDYTGRFSNYNTGWRNILDSQGLSARNSGDITKDNILNVARGNTTAAMLQSLEQDSISAKKVRDRIKAILKDKNGKISDDDYKNLTLQLENDYKDIISLVEEGSYTDANGNVHAGDDAFIDKLYESGIMDPTKATTASMFNMSEIETWVNSVYGNDADAKKNFYTELFGTSDYTDALAGKISKDQMKHIVSKLKTEHEVFYKMGTPQFFTGRKNGKYNKPGLMMSGEAREGIGKSGYSRRNRRKGKGKNSTVVATTTGGGGGSGTITTGGDKWLNIPGESVTSAISRAFGGSEFPDLTGFYEEVDKAGDFGGKKLTDAYGATQFREYSNAAYATKLGDVIHAAKEAYVDFEQKFGKTANIQDKTIESRIKWLENEAKTNQEAANMFNEWNQKADKTDHTKKAGVIGSLKDIDAFIKATSLSEDQYKKRVKNVQSNAYGLGAQIAQSSLSKLKGSDDFIVNEGGVAGQYEGHLLGGQFDTVLGLSGQNASDPFKIITQDIKTRSSTELKSKDLIQPLIYSYYLKQAHEYLTRDDVKQAMNGKTLDEQKQMFLSAPENEAWRAKGKDNPSKFDDKLFKALMRGDVDFSANVQYANRRTGEYSTYKTDLNKLLEDERGKQILSTVIGKGGMLNDDDKTYLQGLGVKSTTLEETGKLANYAGGIGYEVELDTMREINKLLKERLAVEDQIAKLQERKNAGGLSQDEISSLERLIQLEEQHKDNIDDQIENKKAILSDEDQKALEIQNRMNQKQGGAGGVGGSGGGAQKEGLLSQLGYNGSSFKKLLSQYFSFYKVLGNIQRQIQKIIQITKQLDKAATNIRIVTGMNRDEVNDSILAYSNLAQQLGTTTTTMIESANEWLRQGYSIGDSMDLITATTQLSKLGMLDMSSATKVLTSTLKGFNMEASEASDVVDKLTKLDMNYAASAGEIGEAMSRTSAVASQMGMSLDETAAMVTTIMDVTQQSAEVSGTALRSILSRYGNVKAGSFVSMMTEDEDLTKVNDIEKVLNVLGITIRDSKMEMKDMGDVLDELAEKWNTLSSVEQNAVATAFAGTRNRNNFQVLLSNWEQVKEAEETSANSAGTAAEKYEAYMDSMEAAIAKVTNAWETLTQRINASGFAKGLVSVFAKIVENLDKVITGFSALGAFKFIQGKMSGVKGSAITTNGIVKQGFASVEGKLDAINNSIRVQGGAGTTSGNSQQYKKGRAPITQVTDGNGQVIYGQQQKVFTDNALNAQAAQKKWEAGIYTGNGFTATQNEKGQWVDTQTNKILTGKKTTNALNQDMQSTIALSKGNAKETTKAWVDTTTGQQITDPDTIKALQSKATKARRSAAAGAGIVAGVSAAITGPTDSTGLVGKALGTDKLNEIQSDTGDKVWNGVATGVSTGLLTAIPGIGPIIGPILGPILGDGIGSLIKYLRHSDEIAIKERVEEAKQNLEAIENIENAVDDVESAVYTLDSAEDYQKAWDSVKTLTNSLLDNPDRMNDIFKILGSEFNKNFDINTLEEILLGDDDEKKEQVLNVINNYTSSSSAEESAKAQEETRQTSKNNLEDKIDDASLEVGGYKLKQLFSEASNYLDETIKDDYNEYSLKGNTYEEKVANAESLINYLKEKESNGDYTEQESDIIADEISKLEKVISQYSTYINENEKLDRELWDDELSAAFSKSGLSMYDNVNIANSSLEEIVQTFADNLALTGQAVRDYTGEITDTARQQIESYLRSNEKFSALFNGETKTLNDLISTQKEQDELVQKVNNGLKDQIVDYEDLKDAFDHADTDKIEKLAEASGMAADELKKLVYKVDTSELESFANALHMTIDQVEKMQNELGTVTLSDILKTPEELRSSFDELADIFGDIASTGKVTAENLEKLNSEYFSLYNSYDSGGNIESTSASNLYGNLQNRLFGSANDRSTMSYLYQNATFEQLRENSDFYKSYKNKLLKEIEDLSEEQKAELNAASDLNDVIEMVGSNDGMMNVLADLLDDLEMENNYYEELGEKLIEWQKHENETTISNIQSQIDALEDVNSERQKEIDLIKAKEALENAKDEKKRVYRAGIGWTYETDSEAISEAQDKLDELENDKEKENLQYQVDLLEQQNSILDNISENEDLKALKNIFEQYSEYAEENGGVIAGELSTILDFIGTEHTMTWSQYITQMGTKEKVKENANVEKYKNAVEALNNIYNSDTSTNNGGLNNNTTSDQEKHSKQYIANQEAAKGYYDQYLEAKEALENSGYNMNNLSGTTFSNNVDEKWLKTGEINKQAWYNLPKLKSNGKQDGEKTTSLTLGDAYTDTEVNTFLEQYSDLGKNKNKLFISKLNENGNGWDGAITGENLENLSEYSNGTILHIGSTIGSSGNEISRYVIKDGSTWRRLSEFAGGSFGLQKALPALINELGTEGIVTPQGTVTALPAKTGIVPADLTKNLYNLGEVAPNLIKRFETLDNSSNTQNMSSIEDNSMQFENFYATFNTIEDYDFQKLLSNARQYIANTKNLRR